MRKAGRLKNLKINEVSLVDLAANNRDFIILKSKDDPVNRTSPSLTHDEDKLMSFLKKLKKERAFSPTEDDRLKRNRAEEKETRKAEDDDAASSAEGNDNEKSNLEKEGGDEVLRQIYKLLARYLLEDDNEAEEQDLEEDLDNEDDLSTLLMNKSKSKSESKNQTDLAPMNVTHPEFYKLLKSQREILKAQHEELTQAQTEIKLLKQEADERKKQTFIEKAKSLQILGADDQFGLVLKSLAEKTPEEYKKIFNLLEKAADSLSKTDYLDEIGNGFNRDSQSSVAIVQENATVIQKEKNLTQEQAMMKALEADPALYEAYLKEMKHGI